MGFSLVSIHESEPFCSQVYPVQMQEPWREREFPVKIPGRSPWKDLYLGGKVEVSMKTMLAAALALALSVMSYADNAMARIPSPSEIDLGAVKKTKSRVKTKKPTISRPKGTAQDPLRLNIGMGPSFSWFPGVLGKDRGPYMGIALDNYIVVPPSMLKSGKVDSRFSGYIDDDQEIEIRPLWLSLIPTNIYFSPWTDASMMGATWNVVGFDISATPVQELTLSAGVAGPTVTLIDINASPSPLTEDLFMIGVGASVGVKAIGRFSERLQLSTEWVSSFYLPGEDTKYLPTGNSPDDRERIWHIGTLSVMLNYRFALMS